MRSCTTRISLFIPLIIPLMLKEYPVFYPLTDYTKFH